MNRRRALVVGGSKGIGLSIVRTLAASGHDVSVIARQPAPAAPHVTAWAVDLADEDSCQGAMAEILARGVPQHLVFSQRYRGSEEAWAGELGISLTATKQTIEFFSPHLEPGSSIVIVSSVNAAAITNRLPVGYHVAKAALNQMARYYASTLGPKGVRVNSVSPGSVIKDESRGYFDAHQEIEALYRQVVPLGRMGTADDVARVVRFLCSDDSAFVNGQDIVVDGGLSVRLQESVARELSLE